MTKKRRAEIKALVLAYGGFEKLAKAVGVSAAYLYMVICYGTRRGEPEFLNKLEAEIGVAPSEWPKPKRRDQQSSAA